MTNEPDIRRVSDADREAAAEQLRLAVGDGRLDFDELDDRLGATYAAKTHSELALITEDLVSKALGRSTPLNLQTRSGSLNKTGYWSVPDEITIECTSGSVKLDFTEADCAHRHVKIQVSATSGSVVMVVPFGWAVDLDSVATTSGAANTKVASRPEPGSPTLHVTGRVRSGAIKARHPRRTFWQWLTRQPHDPRLRQS